MRISNSTKFGGVVLVGLLASPLAALAMEVKLADPEWNGEEVPEGQQCQRFGGRNPQSPRLEVENIPPEADVLLLEFSDRDVPIMDQGGHGKVAYRLNGENSVTVPPVPGHSEELQEPFLVVVPHKAPQWDRPGAYLPPCSGGKGNDYFVDVKAVKLDEKQQVQEVIASASVKMATY